MPALAEAERAAESGQWVVGYLAYEAAPALDPALVTHTPRAGLPLLYMGVYAQYEETTELPGAAGEYTVDAWHPSLTRRAYGEALARIREYLREGDTYQVNYTFRLRAAFRGDAYGFFRHLQTSQFARHSGFIETDDLAIASASPELFFAYEDGRLVSQPMKGTAERGLTYAGDNAAMACLRSSAKNRAENVMIVDMIRNDLGRVAEAGSVHTASLFDVERYPTVLQMTSTVEARSSSTLSEILRAMFPCASVTGAPKVRTMQIIHQLEDGPRGVYTGCLGLIGPGHRAQFNVSIRTVTIDKRKNTAEYGVGGGVVWDSEEAREYEECIAKAAVLTVRNPEFQLLETMLWEPDGGYFLLDRHLRRVGESAEYFSFAFDAETIRAKLTAFAEYLGGAGDDAQASHRVRLLLDRDGSARLESMRTAPREAPLRLTFTQEPVDSQDPFLYHKTTHRAVYDTAREGMDHLDDVLLLNERGEVTEATLANVVIEQDGRRITPPVDCGLLAGTFRDYLLERGEIREAIVRPEDVRNAARLFLINSVRKWMPAQLSESA